MMLTNHSPPIPEILRMLAASLYITIIYRLYHLMDVPESSCGIQDPLDFPLIRVIDEWLQWFRWWLADGRRRRAVEQRDMKNVVLLDCIRMVNFVTIFIDDLTYGVRSSPFSFHHV